MALGLVGIKRGMSRVFSDNGNSIPVTVIEIIPNFISRVKRKDSDGYDAVQVSGVVSCQQAELPRRESTRRQDCR